MASFSTETSIECVGSPNASSCAALVARSEYAHADAIVQTCTAVASYPRALTSWSATPVPAICFAKVTIVDLLATDVARRSRRRKSRAAHSRGDHADAVARVAGYTIGSR
jgi:hypothetical protein